MGLWTAKQIWQTLTRLQREAAALALWEDERLSRPARLAALAPWLAARGMRSAFLEQLPRSRRAQVMADGGMPEETASQALLSLHTRRQRPLLARFLDELAIPHDDGVIQEDPRPAPPAPDAVARAVERVRAEFPQEDVDLYLRTLTAMDAEMWQAVAAFAGEPP